MVKAPPTPKGFRDIAPDLAKRRRELINKIAATLEQFDFQPMDTPIVEFADTILGKYGSEADRLVYTFEDRGGRKLALRYDLTVPLARYIASNLNLIAKGPFRRYQTGEVFRGENPQKGRWREFTQFDFDIVGSSDLAEDARIVAAALAVCKALGLNGAKMQINDRKNFEGLSPASVRALDKLDKLGDKGVITELAEVVGSKIKAISILDDMKNKKPTEDTEKIFQALKELGVSEDQFEFNPFLARGLDYYTASIFELRKPEYGNLSLGGGGRYDNLIGNFVYPAKRGVRKDIPAVGFSFGLDRLLEIIYP